MFIKQLSLFVENESGSLFPICKVLKDNGINISTLSLADTSQFGILRMLVKDWERAQQVLQAGGFTVKVNDVCAIEVPDHPGGLADLLEIIDRYKLSVEYMYAFTFGKKDMAVMVFRFDDRQNTEQLLQNKAIKIIGSDKLFE